MTTISEVQYVRKYDIFDTATGSLREVQRFDDDTTNPTYFLGELPHKIAYATVSRTRYRNERDSPPGVGYNTRRRAGSYMAPTAYSAYAFWGRRLTVPLRSGDTELVYPQVDSMPMETTAVNGGKADVQARHNYYASLGRLSSAQTAVSILEIKETIGMIGASIVTLTQVIRALKKGRFDLAVDALVDHGVNIPKSKRYLLRNRNKKTGLTKSQWFSNAWLELQFGWKPLLADVYDIASTLSTTMDGEYFPTISIKGYGVEKLSVSQTYMDLYGYSSAEGSSTMRVSYSSLYRINSAPFSFLQAFGLTDPLSVAWEVVPFSFVIDWFLPIGDFLESLRSSSNLTHLHTVKSTIQTGTCKYFLKENQPGPKTGCGMNSSFSTFNRVVESNPPTYPLQFSNPMEIMDLWHVGTSLALLSQFKR